MSAPSIGNSPTVNTCNTEDSAYSSSTSSTSNTSITAPPPGPQASAGISPTKDSYEADAAAVDGRDANTGIETRVLGVRGEVGAQTSVSATMARVGISNESGTNEVHMNAFTGQLSSGTRNADGSTGFNVSANATAIGAEGTYNVSGWSGTVGVAASLGAEGSLGYRDSDGDNKTEYCARVGFLFVTLGGCVENPF